MCQICSGQNAQQNRNSCSQKRSKTFLHEWIGAISLISCKNGLNVLEKTLGELDVFSCLDVWKKSKHTKNLRFFFRVSRWPTNPNNLGFNVKNHQAALVLADWSRSCLWHWTWNAWNVSVEIVYISSISGLCAPKFTTFKNFKWMFVKFLFLPPFEKKTL